MILIKELGFRFEGAINKGVYGRTVSVEGFGESRFRV